MSSYLAGGNYVNISVKSEEMEGMELWSEASTLPEQIHLEDESLKVQEIPQKLHKTEKGKQLRRT